MVRNTRASSPPGASAARVPAARRATRRFVLRFFGALFLASLAFSLGELHRHLFWLQSAIAHAAALGARWLGASPTVNGSVITVSASAALDINHECTGIFILFIYAAFLLAYPARWGDRLLGAVLGVVLIEAVNIARLATLTVVFANWPGAFDYFHEYLWQGLLIALVAVLMVSWSGTVDRHAVVSR